MPSKKNKAKGKARRAAKSRKAREEDGEVNGIDSKMQRLQISNNKNSQEDGDEDALLEEAINRAAAEKEELEAAAKNDEDEISCAHTGKPLLPSNHVCVAFIRAYINEYNAYYDNNQNVYSSIRHVYEATKAAYAEVWSDSDNLKRVASHFILYGTDTILDGNYYAATSISMFSCYFEQWAATVAYQNETQASCDWNKLSALCHWGKIIELIKGDEHTLVSFFRKRITCKCLDKKYEEVKSIKKIGICHNEDCSLPGNKTERSKMLYCTQCRKTNYCSKECQVAHWPSHKGSCVMYANMRTEQKSRKKK